MRTIRDRVPLPILGDVLLAGLFLLAAELDVWVRHTVVGPRVENAVILAFVAPPLIWRRRWPEATVVVIGAVIAVQAAVVGHPPSGFLFWPILIGAYSLGAHAPASRRPIAALALLLAAYLYVAVLGLSDSQFNVTVVPWMLAPVFAWLAGRYMRRRRQVATIAAETTQREREREQGRLAALETERARMARDLHDILAHSVSLMGVQAGAAEEVLAHDPERARPALRSIQQTARESVGELRRLLGMLRADDLGPELAPQPSLGELDALVARIREAGLPVRLFIEGAPHPLAPGVELTAYRVVQEALTNALKHARPTHVDVVLRYRATEIELTVENDGVSSRANGTGGHGLVGMRERVLLYGGALDAGARADGSFRVRVAIPVELAPT